MAAVRVTMVMTYFGKPLFLPVLLVSAISFEQAARNRCDRQNEAPKASVPRWNDSISIKTIIHHSSNTATADACIQDFCTAIAMQCFCNTNRSQSMLTTIQVGVSTVFSTAHERDSFHSLLTRFLWTCAAILY